jgi:hypothetical protein
MSRKKRNRFASVDGAVAAPSALQSAFEPNEVEDMEEQEIELYEDSTQSAACQHGCEFGCSDDECLMQEKAEKPAAEVEPAVEEVQAVVEVVPVAEPDPVVEQPAAPAVAHEVAQPVQVAPKPAPVAPSSQPATAKQVSGGSQTASKFASILNEKSAASARYFGKRTRY